MKKLPYFFLCLFVLAFFSCEEKDEAAPVLEGVSISAIQIDGSISKSKAHTIEVTIAKPTPCHAVQAVRVSASDYVVHYNFVLENTAEVCAQVIEEEKVTVAFEPQHSGTYTLNFLINGRQYQSRQVQVGE